LRNKARAIVALAILASLISFVKFSHCESSGWATPDQYIHACYSDIPALYGERGLSKGEWAYSNGSDSVEYPVLTGAVMWTLAHITPHGDNAVKNYFNINIFFIALLLILISLMIYKFRPDFAYLYPLAPAGIASLYINWDLWAIISMVGAIIWFDRKKLDLSALALGISISTKFMPIFLLFPIAFIFLRRNQLKGALRYLLISAITFAAFNLPVYLSTPEGWLRFYQLNISRGSDWGSLWYALTALGFNLANLNYLSILILLAGFAAIAIYILELRNIPSLASLSFIVLATVMCASKVYSPQYVLWLIPLAVIALTDKRDLHAFWIWQGGEIIYHIAIWQHLATVTGAKFGLPVFGYAIATLIRIAVTIYLLAILVRRGLATGSQSDGRLGRLSHRSLREFLFDSASAYP
jgi:uncharacterized membrane protein